MKRYLVLIHFASKISRSADGIARARAIREAFAREFSDWETVLSSEVAIAACGVSGKDPRALWRALALPVYRQDNLSIIQISGRIATTHPGLVDWANRTALLGWRSDSGQTPDQAGGQLLDGGPEQPNE